MTDGWYLAEVNVSSARFDLDAPEMAGFTGRLDEINAIADSAPGFVWRLQTEAGNATDVQLFPDRPRLIVNLSVWEDFESLSAFVFRTDHLGLMQARHEWFETDREATFAMWWIPADGPMPSVGEAWERLTLLRERGPTPAAFPLKRRFAVPKRERAAGEGAA